MTPIEFLQALWSGEGVYCLAIPRGNGAFKHWTFDTIEDAARQAVTAAAKMDIYFNVHTLKQKQVQSPTEIDPRTGQPKLQVRVQWNMRAARCFFFDIDVGKKDCYPDQREALSALIQFTRKTKLPRPMVVSSGRGLHVYWRMVDALPSDEWRDHAARMRQLAIHHGLKVDRSRTTDSSSVLRVAGTLNHKDPLNPSPVQVLLEGDEIGTGALTKAISDAVVDAAEVPAFAPRLNPPGLLGSNTDMPYDGPRPKMRAVFLACEQMRRIGLARGQFSEPEWYRMAIGVGRFTEEGNRGVHQLSRGHPGYSEAACNAKIKQNEAAQRGPSSCATVAAHSEVGDAPCMTCPFRADVEAGRIHGPIQAALYRDPAPPPVHMELVGDQEVSVTLPDPPKPFMRLKDGGGIAIVAKNADGSEETQKIYDYDLYPIRRLSNPIQGVEQQVWHVCLPNGEARDLTFDADQVYDMRKFVVTIANNGIYPHKGHIPHLQEYMVAYIAQLQKLAAADAQCNHLGWADDHAAFILPDKIMHLDGTVTPSQLSVGAQRASAAVEKKGSIVEQVRLLQFYAHPDYLPNQFFILAGLGSPIFYATGHHGVVVNASGDAGASKSTTLYTAASQWGHPKLYPINGTNNGATMRGRNERVTVLANLPIAVDEITHMPAKDAIDLAMSVTQPGHRIRLQTDGVERASIGSHKATTMLTTANNSLHSVLSLDNAAGTAGSMRVFEILFQARSVHKKHEADEYLFELEQHYGWIGERFMAYVLANRDKVVERVRKMMKAIDEEAQIQSSERFWSAIIAVVLVTAEIARELGLLMFSPDALRRWAIEHQIPHMRGVVKQEYSDPLSVVADYLEQINGNIVVMRKGNGNISNILHQPRGGALLAHYDVDDGLMYVLKKAFKDHCARIGANSTKIIDDLHQHRDGARIIPLRETRRTLGAGTDLAKGQSWCFSINMAHPSVSGVVPMTVIQGGAQVAPLKAAK